MVRDILPDKSMVPPAPHAAAVPAMIDVTVCGAPPSVSIRLSSVNAKNPIERLSGDQNGRRAP
jgi:hypothetical protein